MVEHDDFGSLSFDGKSFKQIVAWLPSRRDLYGFAVISSQLITPTFLAFIPSSVYREPSRFIVEIMG